MTSYVLWFIVTTDLQCVALIRKTHGPAGMAGKLNGVGGHVQPRESAIDAMVREAREETGYDSNAAWWHQFATMFGPGWVCDCFRSVTNNPNAIRTMTEETVEWYSVAEIVSGSSNLPPHIMDNLRWLIPLALCGDPGNVMFTAVYP